MWRLDVVVFDGVDSSAVAELGDIISTANSLAMTRQERRPPMFDLRLLSADTDRAVATMAGSTLVAHASVHAVSTGDVVWIPTGDVWSVYSDGAVLRRLREARSLASIVVGVGAGCAVLAAAGLLRGHVELDPPAAAGIAAFDVATNPATDIGSAYVDRGDLMTSTATGANGLALHLVARRGGHRLARNVARTRGIVWDEDAGATLPPVAGEGLF